MAAARLEKVFASGMYLMMGVSASMYSVGLANGLASGDHYSIQQKLLIAAVLTGAAMLLVAAILVHFRPANAYILAMVALPLLLRAFWPLMSIIIHRTISLPSIFRFYGIQTFCTMVLLALLVFTLTRLVRLVRS